MLPERDDVYLLNMLDAARDARLFVEGLTLDQFLGDRLRQMGVRLAIQIIGEAARHVSDATRNRFPELPWAQIVGMRHQLVHRYWDVNVEIVWDVVQRDVPELIAALERLIPPPEDE